MNLISCDNCGAVLDLDKTPMPTFIYEDGCVDQALGLYSSEHRAWVPYIKCPVCAEPIPGDPL